MTWPRSPPVRKWQAGPSTSTPGGNPIVGRAGLIADALALCGRDSGGHALRPLGVIATSAVAHRLCR